MENSPKKSPNRYKERTNLTLDPYTKAAALEVSRKTRRNLSLLVDDGLRLIIAEQDAADASMGSVKVDLKSTASQKPRRGERSA